MSAQLSSRKTGGGLLFTSEALKDLLGSKGPTKKKKPVSSTSTSESARRSDDLIRDILREETGSLSSARFTKVVKKPKSNKDKKHSKASKKTRAALLYGGAGSGDEAYDATAKMGVRENIRAMRAASNSVQSYASLLGMHSDDVLYLERQYWQVHKIVVKREKKLKDAYDQLVGENDDFNENDARLLLTFAGVPVDDHTYETICENARMHAANSSSAAKVTATTTKEVLEAPSGVERGGFLTSSNVASRKPSIHRPDSTGASLINDDPAAFSVTVNGGEHMQVDDTELDDKLFVNPLGGSRNGTADPMEMARRLRGGSGNNVESPIRGPDVMNFQIWLSGLMWHLRQRLLTCVLGERYGHTLPQYLEKVEIGEMLSQSTVNSVIHSVARSEEVSLADHMGVDERETDEYLGVGEMHFGSMDESKLPRSLQGNGNSLMLNSMNTAGIAGIQGMSTVGGTLGGGSLSDRGMDHGAGDLSSRSKRGYPGPAVDDIHASMGIGIGSLQRSYSQSHMNHKAATLYTSASMSRSMLGTLPPVKLQQMQTQDAKRRLVEKAGFDASLGRETPRCLKLGVQAPASGALVDPKGIIATVEALRKELQVAQAGMSLINTRMEENIAWVRSNCEMPEGMTISTRTRDRCRAIALERLFAVLTGCVQTRLQLTLNRWKSVCHFERLQRVAKHFSRAKSLQLLSHALFEALCRQYLRALQPWRAMIRREKRREQNVAAMEIQRAIRGFLGRVRVQKIQLHYSAVKIQCLARNKRARGVVRQKRERAEKLRMFAAALTLQHLFKGLRRIREAKNEVERRKMNRAATKIQRIARGNIGRARFKRVKEETIRREKRRLARLKKEEEAKKLRWQQLQEKRAKEKADAAAAKAEKEKKLRDAANAKAEAILAARQAALAKNATSVGDAIAQSTNDAAERRKIKAKALEDAKREQQQQEQGDAEQALQPAQADAASAVVETTEVRPYDPDSQEAAKAAIKLQSLARGRSVRMKREELAKKREDDHSRLMGTNKGRKNSASSAANGKSDPSSAAATASAADGSGKGKRAQSPAQSGKPGTHPAAAKRPPSGPHGTESRAPSRGKPHPPSGPPGTSPPGSSQANARPPSGSPPKSAQKPRPPPPNRGASTSPQKRPSIQVNTDVSEQQQPQRGESAKGKSPKARAQSATKSPSSSAKSPSNKKQSSPQALGAKAAFDGQRPRSAKLKHALSESMSGKEISGKEGGSNKMERAKSEFISKDDLKIPGFEDAVADFREKTKPAVNYNVVGTASRLGSQSPSPARSRPESPLLKSGSRPSSAARAAAGADVAGGSRPGSAKRGASGSRPSSAVRKPDSNRPSSATRSRDGAAEKQSSKGSLLMSETPSASSTPSIPAVKEEEASSEPHISSFIPQDISKSFMERRASREILPAIPEGDAKLAELSVSAEHSIVDSGDVPDKGTSFASADAFDKLGEHELGSVGTRTEIVQEKPLTEDMEWSAHDAEPQHSADALQSTTYGKSEGGGGEGQDLDRDRDRAAIIEKRRAAEQRRVAEEKARVEAMIAAEQRAEDEKKRRDEERQRAIEEAEKKRQEKLAAAAARPKSAGETSQTAPSSSSKPRLQSPGDRPSSRGFGEVLGSLFGGRPASASAQSRIPEDIVEEEQKPPRVPISYEEAAVKVIARVRIFLAKRRVIKKREIMMKAQKRAGLLLWWAVVTIQRIVRGKLGKKRFERRKIERKEEMIKKKEKSAVIIQKVMRGFLGRRRVRRMREMEKKKRQDAKLMAYARGEIELDGSVKKKGRKGKGKNKGKHKKHRGGDEDDADADDEFNSSSEDEAEVDPEEAAQNRKRKAAEKEQEAEAGKQLQEKLKKVDAIDTVKETTEEQRKLIEEQSQLIKKLLEDSERTKRKLEEIERLQMQEAADFAARQQMLAMAAGPINSAYNSLGPNSGRPPVSTRSGRSTGRHTAPPSARSAKDGTPRPENAPTLTVNGDMWTQLWDADAQRHYWWCDATQVSQWEKPAEGGTGADSGYDTDAASVMTDYTTDNYESGAEYADSEFGGGDTEWQEYWDEQAQAKYWYNNITGEASWTKPEDTQAADQAPVLSKASARILENPDDWVSYIDETTGQEYWYNGKTGESSWA